MFALDEGWEDGIEIDGMLVCDNCWKLECDIEVNLDHWSGRNYCIECEPHPMMDDGTRR